MKTRELSRFKDTASPISGAPTHGPLFVSEKWVFSVTHQAETIAATAGMPVNSYLSTAILRGAFDIRLIRRIFPSLVSCQSVVLLVYDH